MLPLTAAASRKMRTKWGNPGNGRGDNLLDLSPINPFLSGDNFYVQIISGSTKGNKDRLPVQKPQTTSTINQTFDSQSGNTLPFFNSIHVHLMLYDMTKRIKR
jgi:hypothetical protein